MTEQSGQPGPTAPPVCYRHTTRETYISCQRCGKPICPDCMNSAAVGFQCPDCVKEGAKSTRSGRTAYGGQVSANPALTSQVLIALNLAVWVAILATGWRSSTLVDRLALLPQSACFRDGIGCTPVEGVSGGAYWQLLTSMFTHVDIWHIGFNMLALWILGPQLELALGRARFLALYFLSGFAGSVMVLWFSGMFTFTLGASGAIFGLLGGLLVVALKVKGDVQGLLIWIGLNAFITFTIPNISWQGHLGGFLGGVAITAALVLAPKERRTTWQVVALALIAVLLVVATAVRVAALA